MTTTALDERARAAVRAFLSIDEGDHFPTDAVHALAVLNRWVEQTLRTAVLDRRAFETWADIARDLGVSPQAARKKYVAPARPHLDGEVDFYANRDAYYEARPQLADGWDYEPGETTRGSEPFGADLGTIVVGDVRWRLTVAAPRLPLRFDHWPRVGSPSQAVRGDAVATNLRTGQVAVIGHDIPLGAASRILTSHAAKSLQALATALATEAARHDAVQPLPAEMANPVTRLS